MKPVRTAAANFVYQGPRENIGDLHVERGITAEGYAVVRTVFEFTDAERELIAAGGRLELSLYTEPIPPISMNVLPEAESRPVGEHGWKGLSTDDVPDSLPEDFS